MKAKMVMVLRTWSCLRSPHEVGVWHINPEGFLLSRVDDTVHIHPLRGRTRLRYGRERESACRSETRCNRDTDSARGGKPSVPRMEG